MNTHAKKTQENKSQSVANAVSEMQRGGESTFQFIDNRPEASASLQEMVNKSPQVKKAAQLQAIANNYSAQQQHPFQKKASPEHSDKPNVQDGRKENNTGLPDNLKSGIENLSGMSLDDVKVHRNSDKPAQLQAHAFAQGTDIHLASGQEKHLPHKAWHVVQQAQERVKPTTSVNGMAVNDNQSLEKEADRMGAKAMQPKVQGEANRAVDNSVAQKKSNGRQGFGFVDNRPETVAQRKLKAMTNNNSQTKQPIQLPTVFDNYSAQNREIKDDNTLNHKRAIIQLPSYFNSSGNIPLQREIIGIDDSHIWSTEIARRVTEEKDPKVTLAVHRLHSINDKIRVSDYDTLRADILNGQYDSFLSRSELESPDEVKYDNETGAESAFVDPLFPNLKFYLNPKLTEEYQQDVYDVTGTGLKNPTTITREGFTYYGLDDNSRWTPQMTYEDGGVNEVLKLKLNKIARLNFGKNCHIVAENMKDAFSEQGHVSMVYEIYTEDAAEDGNHITVMGARVRNHYVNVFNGRVYDSSTGGHGMPLTAYLAGLQSNNEDRQLQHRLCTDN